MKQTSAYVISCSLLSLIIALTAAQRGRPNKPKPRPSSAYGSETNPIDYDHVIDYTSDSNEQVLIKKLLRNYTRQGRPVHDPGEHMTIRIKLAMLQIKDLDEREQVLISRNWLEAVWNDDFLVWNPDQYEGINYIALYPGDIWVPELAIGNSVHDIFDKSYQEIRLIVLNNGTVLWWPGGLFHTSCQIQIFYFPFDDQKCRITIQQWTFFEDKVFLTSTETAIDLSEYRVNGQWEIIRTHVFRESMAYPLGNMSAIHFDLYIRRRSAFIVINVLVPCLLIAALDMMVFYLAPDSGEKIGLGTTVLLALTVFLLLISEIVPRTSDAIPILTIYLTALMIITTLSVFCSILILRIHHHDTSTPAGPLFRFLYRFVSRIVAPVMLYEEHRNNRVTQQRSFYQSSACNSPISGLTESRHGHRAACSESSPFSHEEFRLVSDTNHIGSRSAGQRLYETQPPSPTMRLSQAVRRSPTQLAGIGAKLACSANRSLSEQPDAAGPPVNTLHRAFLHSLHRQRTASQTTVEWDRTESARHAPVARIRTPPPATTASRDLARLSAENEKMKYRFVAMVCDRFLLILFIVVNLVLTLVILIVIPLAKKEPEITNDPMKACDRMLYEKQYGNLPYLKP